LNESWNDARQNAYGEWRQAKTVTARRTFSVFPALRPSPRVMRQPYIFIEIFRPGR
jgi:hypothetical protein